MSDRTRHIVAFYEIDRAYGGPEEGAGGTIAASCAAFFGAGAAYALAARADRLMDRLQRGPYCGRGLSRRAPPCRFALPDGPGRAGPVDWQAPSE